MRLITMLFRHDSSNSVLCLSSVLRGIKKVLKGKISAYLCAGFSTFLNSK